MVVEGQKGEILCGAENPSLKGSHFMTVDKIVANFTGQDLARGTGNIKFNTVKSQGLFISDFDNFMPDGNKIIK